MWSKKGGVESKVPTVIVESVFGVIIFLAIMGVLALVLYMLFGLAETCDNTGEWEKLVSEFKKADNSKTYDEEVFFYNGEMCGIVGFSAAYLNPSESVYRGKDVSVGTTICLCQFENQACNADHCYNFKNIKGIETLGGSQFSTKGIPGYVNLIMKRQGDSLVLNSPNPSKIRSSTYTSSPESKLLDEGIVTSFNIVYTSTSGDPLHGFIYPYVTPDVSLPQPSYVPSVPSPLKMKIKAAFSEGQTIKELIANPNLIRLQDEFITKSEMTFLIPENYANSFATTSLRLSHLDDGEWVTNSLHCEEKDGGLFCSVGLDKFAEYWVISV